MDERHLNCARNDRGYKEGDNIHFKEWTGQYTGREEMRHISYILRDCPEYGLKEGYCILALEAKKEQKKDRESTDRRRKRRLVLPLL